MNKKDIITGVLRHLALIAALLAMMSIVASIFEKRIQKAVSQAENKNPTTETALSREYK